MFSNTAYSGKHLICDIKNIKNKALIGDLDKLKTLMNDICAKNNYSILQTSHHQFEPQGFSIIYLLSESHMSIHTFPEKNYAAIDLYTCRQYNDNHVYNEIYNYFVSKFDAKSEIPIIIDRCF